MGFMSAGSRRRTSVAALSLVVLLGLSSASIANGSSKHGLAARVGAAVSPLNVAAQVGRAVRLPLLRRDIDSCIPQVTQAQENGYLPGALSMYGRGYEDCGALVSGSSVWLTLDERWTSDDQLHPMAASPVKDEYGGGKYYVSASVDCRASSERRWWRVEVFAHYSTRYGGQEELAQTSVYGCRD